MSTPQLSGQADVGQVANALNGVIRDIAGSDVTKIYKDDSGTRRVLIGKRGDSYGLFVSQPGFDVFDADNADLAFNSNQNTLKIVASGVTEVFTKTAGSTGDLYTVAHGLDFVPQVIAYLDDGGGIVYSPLPKVVVQPTGGSAGLIFFHAETSVNQFDVNFIVSCPNIAGNTYYTDELNFRFKYFLLQESAATS